MLVTSPVPLDLAKDVSFLFRYTFTAHIFTGHRASLNILSEHFAVALSPYRLGFTIINSSTLISIYIGTLVLLHFSMLFSLLSSLVALIKFPLFLTSTLCRGRQRFVPRAIVMDWEVCKL